MRRTVGLFILFIFSQELKAQNYPLYNGYFLNPFFYNPAAAASEQLQVTGGYRRQWVEIPNAPSIATLTANTLLNETRAGVGFKISSFSRGFLNSTDVSLSYAYGVPLNKTSRLFFGLSGGVSSNSVNLSDINAANDPALSTLSSSLTPSISFGMLYKNTNGLNLGVTFPKMLRSQNLDSRFSYSQFDDIMISASFSKWDPSPKFVKGKSTKSFGKGKKKSDMPLEVFSLYRYSTYGGLIEATAKYNFNKSVWLSATYRQYQGVIPGIGFNMDNISFSYFYEVGVGGDLPLKTHEVLLSVRLGKDKKFRELEPTPPTTKLNVNQPNQVAKKPAPTMNRPPATTKNPVVTPPVVKKDPPVVVAKKEETAPPVVKKEETAPPVVKKEEVKQPAPVVVKKDSSANPNHRPRLKQNVSSLDDLTSPDTTSLKHENERKVLDQHLEDHNEGKHDDTHTTPINQRHDFVKRGTHHEELEIATYVISGAFSSRANAEHYTTALKKLGYTADFGHLSARNLWYVYIAEDPDIPQAKKERDQLQKNKIFKDVWLLTVQE